LGWQCFKWKIDQWFHVFLGSGAINWNSKKQPTIALSSTEAEYRSAVIAACEIVWLQKLLSDLG